MDERNANWLLNAAFATCFAAFGFVVNIVFDDIEKLNSTDASLPLTYVLKADYRDDQAELISTLNGIRVDLKHNAEYIEADYNRRMDKLEELLNKSLHSHANK
jgi:hypothetical protein